MRPHISGGWLVGMPDVISPEYAVQAFITFPPPTWLNHSPSPVGDDLSNTNALVPWTVRKLVLISVRCDECHGRLRYRSGSGTVTGGAFSGDLLGGGGITGS